MLSHLMTRKEVAARLRVSERTVIRLQNNGTLPHIRLGRATRYEASEVDALIRRSRKVT